MGIEYWKIMAFTVFFIVLAYVIFPRGQKLTEMYIDSYQWDEAFKLIEKELKKEPENPGFIKNMARYVEVQGDTEKELKLYEKLVELRPHNTQYRAHLAQLYRWNNRVEDELKQLEEIARLAPNDVETHARLVDFYHWYKKLDRSLPHHLKLIELEPGNPDHYLGLADTYLHLNQYDKGIAIYEKLIRRFKNNAEYHFILGDVYEWRKHFDDALREYLAYLELRFPSVSISKKLFKTSVHFTEPFDEKDKEVFSHITMIKTEQKKVKDAERMFESLEASFPDQKEWIEKRAKFYVGADQIDLALSMYQKLSEKFPKELSYLYEMAQIYIWKDKMKEAFGMYQKLAKEDPSSLKAHFGLAYAYAVSDYPEEAYQEYEWILKREPENEKALEGLAQTSLWTNRIEKGLEVYQFLIQRYPQNEAYRRALGFLYFWAGSYDEAQRYLEAHLKKYPKDWEVKVAMADIYGTLEQVEQRDRYYQEIVTVLEKKHIKTKEDLELLAQSYFVQQDLSKAAKIYESLLEKNPQNSDLKMKSAALLEAQEEHEKAYDMLQEIDSPSLKDRQKEQLQLMRASLYDSRGDFDQSEIIYRRLLEKKPGHKEAQGGLLPVLFENKNYFEAQTMAKELKSNYSLWLQEELKKQIALKSYTKFRFIETINKKSTVGDYTHEVEGRVTKYLRDRWEGHARYQYARVKNTSVSPLMHADISTVGLGVNYDFSRKLKGGVEPQLTHSGLWTTGGVLGGVQWYATDTLYVDVTGRLHELWTNPLDAVRYKATKNGADLYFDYKPWERLNIIGSTGVNMYFMERKEGQGLARTGTFKTLVTLWLNPKIEIGYFLDTQHASQNRRLEDTTPLTRRIAAHYIIGQFDIMPTQTVRIFMNGAIGEDQKRQLTMGEASLFNYLLKGEWQISDRLFLEALYSYSSVSSLTSSGIQAVALGQLSYSFH